MSEDVKAARRFAELQRRAPIRAPRARKRAINRYVIIPPWRLKRIACSARSLQLQTVDSGQPAAVGRPASGRPSHDPWAPACTWAKARGLGML